MLSAGSSFVRIYADVVVVPQPNRLTWHKQQKSYAADPLVRFLTIISKRHDTPPHLVHKINKVIAHSHRLFSLKIRNDITAWAFFSAALLLLLRKKTPMGI